MKQALISIVGISVLGMSLAWTAADAAEQARIEVAQKSPYGTYLADGDGRSLYLFSADSKMNSTCYDACANAWPPLLTEGEPSVAQGIDPERIATIERKDGSKQVTYNGWPLYRFVKDQKPGDTNGQDVKGFGAEWYLISPKGEKIGD